MEHLYFVTYDIRDDRRWRQVFKKMKGYGQWMQYSVFQCRMDKAQYFLMTHELKQVIDRTEDHILIIDIGPADAVQPKVTSMGKAFEPIEKKPVIV